MKYVMQQPVTYDIDGEKVSLADLIRLYRAVTKPGVLKALETAKAICEGAGLSPKSYTVDVAVNVAPDAWTVLARVAVWKRQFTVVEAAEVGLAERRFQEEYNARLEAWKTAHPKSRKNPVGECGDTGGALFAKWRETHVTQDELDVREKRYRAEQDKPTQIESAQIEFDYAEQAALDDLPNIDLGHGREVDAAYYVIRKAVEGY